jgi:methyl-accepting chemotaxis protein
MKLTVGKKIIASYLFILLFLSGTIGGGFYGMQRMQKQADAIVHDAIPISDAASSLLTALVNEETGVRGYLVSGDESFLEPYNTGRKMIEESLSIINSHLDGHPIMAELVKEATPKINAIQDYFQSQIDLVKAGKIEDARANVGKGKVLFDSFRETNAKIDSDIKKLTNDAWNTSKDAKNSAQVILIVIGIIALIGTVVSAALLIKIISKPVAVVSSALERLSEGDLTIEEIKVKSEDEIGILTQALNKTVVNLRNLIVKVSEASTQIASSSQELTASAEQSADSAGQVASSTQESASGAEEQSEKVNEVIESVEQMTSDINAINNNSKEMLQLSLNASAESEQGARLLNEVVNEMTDINSSVQETSQVIKNLDKKSQEVGNIIKIITDITSQTNLLALNAAIEAARAGEMGRGFAVVAEEVRKLAEESKDSAEQIANLIGAIQLETGNAVVSMSKESEKVLYGLEKTYKVNEAFKTIEKNIVNVTDRVQEVSSSLEKMNLSSNQIIGLVETVGEKASLVAQSSQDNSAAVEEQLATMEEISASSQSLSDLAEELGVLMSQFKI